MGLLKRFWNWFKEPRRTPGEQWAIDNGVHEQYLQGYDFRMRNRGYQPVRWPADSPEYKAHAQGILDAEFDNEIRNW